MEEHILKISNLNKSFKQIHAVNDLNFTVNKGDIYGFLGPNGSGKSTTIRMILSLIYPDSGNIEVFGQPLNRDKYKILSKVGALIERPDFYNHLSAIKNLKILNDYASYKLNVKDLEEVLDLVGLLDRATSKVDTFSQGMKQRLGIAQTLMHDPDLIILDEPANGLDPQGIKDIRDLIINLNEQKNKTIFISSHILKEIEVISNRMLVINNGKIIVEGNVQELLNAQSKKVRFVVNDYKLAEEKIMTSNFANLFLECDSNNEIILAANKEQIPAVVQFFMNNNIKVYAIDPIRSLEEYFLNIM